MLKFTKFMPLAFNGRWLKNIFPLLATITLLLILSVLSMYLLSSVDACTSALGQYSKAQKEAVLNLLEYTKSQDETDYQQFLQAISVPLGTRQAGLALNELKPNLDAARQGFQAARNHRDDVTRLIWMFMHFSNASFMSDVIVLWADADGQIEELAELGDDLHVHILAGHPDDAAIYLSVGRIKHINVHLNALENKAFILLNDASRSIRDLLLWITLSIGTALIGIGSVVARSILKKKEALQSVLQISEERLHLAMLGNSDGIWDLDVVAKRIYYSPRLKELLEEDSSETIFTYQHFLQHVHPDDLDAMQADVGTHLCTHSIYDSEFRIVTQTGQERWLRGRGQSVLNALGEPVRMVGSMADITERKQAELKIVQLAFHDPLTQLSNRRRLTDQLQQAITTNSSSFHTGALLYIDLDNFKTINDTRGHDMGDLLLRQVALRLTANVRASDTVARLGGDEFIVLLADLDSANQAEAANKASVIAEKILLALSASYLIAGSEHIISASIGITLFLPQDRVSDLLKRADMAMYQAKTAGRNTLRFFDPQMQFAISAREAMIEDLRLALAREELSLYYQTQVDRDGSIKGVEALLRWQHPQHGMILPAEFIPLAEERGMILPIGLWVLERACAQLAAWGKRAKTASLTIAVGVSVRQFTHPDFVVQVNAVLTRSGANPGLLKLEITESLMVKNIDQTITKMVALKSIGLSFSLSNFGTGYSSLAQLKRFPLDQVKIDQTFVKDLLTDPNDAAIARTIIALGQNLGLTIIADGVESEAQRVFLARLGCHAYQGYLFSQALPIGSLEEVMRENRRIEKNLAA